jgi:hypothetical protein
MQLEPARQAEIYVLNTMFLKQLRAQEVYASGVDAKHVGLLTVDAFWLIANAAVTTLTKAAESIAPNEATFEHLRQEWHKERGATSSITDMSMCPSYQRIIAMGPTVVPTILQQLELEGDEPDMWFWALRVLTNADPITDEDRGDIVKMADAWLKWARGRYAW